MSTFLLEIVTPDRLVYSEQVNRVTVRGVEGELGILPGHISFVTPLQIAPVYVVIGNQRTPYAVQGGFVEVRKDKVVILAESAEKAEEIDLERAKAAKDRAEARLKAGKQDEVDHRRAELSLQRAMNRIKINQ
ncbi:F0F1 ATP synthase subunit epsilon [Paenibacillus sp. JCM 10914]|uniref:F0F1 ATP synthase subunit epsilon n=1 Tax=Paenibacillus sp. JCM 10914 TaxID=1236974 RepID=UPI0003CC8E81|nr:F0F1 ATP synthase subunit epsilon [Paenibacillus sp. JCM 10914]GAE09992.1 ATP synthase epsilon chain [Paenibacillus sp. JCM 10914]